MSMIAVVLSVLLIGLYMAMGFDSIEEDTQDATD